MPILPTILHPSWGTTSPIVVISERHFIRLEGAGEVRLAPSSILQDTFQVDSCLMGTKDIYLGSNNLPVIALIVSEAQFMHIRVSFKEMVQDFKLKAVTANKTPDECYF